ncbi:MAG TPA: SDR family NAD(P)-dependent oxidoreductase [Steroidobacteraceae bacterium]|jgi:dehydrogenase/reductase SDR family protein 12|nr:SDR family NAD(P)-dependent oxidoreductase [Steroidobacteraceae bacterium]
MNLQQLKKIVAFYSRFTASFTQVGYRWRSLGWERFTPDYRGQRWLVTGGSGGIGRHIVLAAAGAGAEVVAVARSAGKLDQLRTAASTAGIAGVTTETCDFTLQSDTERLLQRLEAGGRAFDVLVNNVGVLLDDLDVTREGREASFVTNLLSHYQLTEGLVRRGLLRAPGGCVVNMTSGGGYNMPLMVGMLNVTDPRTYNGVFAYGFHKRAQMVLNQYWRDKYGPRGIQFYVMHPGWADTDGVKRSLPRFRKILRPILRNEASGADTALWLAARRPPQPEHECVWFDRAVRTAHVYERTRATKDTPESLVAYLDRELERQAASA